VRAPSTERRRTARRFCGVGTAAVLLLLGACAQEATAPDTATGTGTGTDVGEFAATSDYLSAVADATDGSTYRMAMDMTMRVGAEGESLEMGGPIMTGEADGDLSAMKLDIGELFRDAAAQAPADDPIPEGFLDGDLTMEMVSDGQTLYLRAPLFAAIAEMALDSGATRGDLGPLAELAALGQEWGRVDLSEMSPSEIASTVGSQTTDPKVFLDMVAQGTDVRDLGTQTIDGDQVRGLSATVTYEDMIEAQDLDVDDVRGQFGPVDGPPPDDVDVDELLDALFAMEMPLEVWVDDDDHVRRITMAMDMAPAFESLGDEAMGGATFSVDFSVDFFDYGDESIEIEVPTAAVDVTDEFLELEDGGGVGGPTVGST
jgi:hypothetical protein